MLGTNVIHKHSSCMAILNRLPTGDRMFKWGAAEQCICCFCQQEVESRDHLFFGCSVSRCPLQQVLFSRGLSRIARGWLCELSWAEKKLKGKALVSVVLRVAWNVYIHNIRKERNNKRHGKAPQSMANIFDSIIFSVQIATFKIRNVKADVVNMLLYRNFNLGFTILY